MRREPIAALGMTFGLLAGCTAESVEAPQPSYEVSAQDVKTEATRAYAETKNFWTAQGVGSAPAFSMPETETITCGTQTVTPEKGNEVIAAACHVNNTLYIWPKPLAEQAQYAVERGAVLTAVVRLVVGHEYAHFVQEQMNVRSHPDYKRIAEPQADCMAGAVMRTTHPGAATSVKIYYEAIEEHLGRPDTKHGSGAQRLASFMQGHAPPAGENCDNVVPLK